MLVYPGLLLLSFSTRADDWPVFRGPGQDGISRESGWKIPAAGSQAPVAWKASVGLGYSAAAVAAGKVYITGHQDGKDTDHVHCFEEATGKQLWTFAYPQPKGDLYFQGGTTGTVTADGDKVFQIAREGDLFCLNAADGSIAWKKHLHKDLGYTSPDWGFTGSPLAVGDRLYIAAGSAGLALNKASGEVIWKSDDLLPAGYATPRHFIRQGEELLIFTNKNYYTCVAAANGEKKWEIRWMTRYGVNAANPVVSGDELFLSTGYGKGAAYFLMKGSAAPEEVWKSREMRNQMNGSILIDGYLYGIDGNESEDGTGLKCLEMKTGKSMWSDPTVAAGTMMAADGKLIVLTENGELQIAPVSPQGYQPVFRQQVIAPRVWTVPVLANGRVYCRNAKGDLVVVDLRGPAKP